MKVVKALLSLVCNRSPLWPLIMYYTTKQYRFVHATTCNCFTHLHVALMPSYIKHQVPCDFMSSSSLNMYFHTFYLFNVWMHTYFVHVKGNLRNLTTLEIIPNTSNLLLNDYTFLEALLSCSNVLIASWWFSTWDYLSNVLL